MKMIHVISIKLDGSDYMGKVIAYNLIAFLAAVMVQLFF